MDSIAQIDSRTYSTFTLPSVPSIPYSVQRNQKNDGPAVLQARAKSSIITYLFIFLFMYLYARSP